MWTTEDKKQIMQVLRTVCEMQNNYGKQVNPENMLKGYQLVLEKHLTASEVIQGIGMFLERNRDLPAPADINNIMNPAPEPLSPARYQQAITRLNRNGFDYYDGRNEDKEYVAAFEARENQKVQEMKQDVPEIAQAVDKKLLG